MPLILRDHIDVVPVPNSPGLALASSEGLIQSEDRQGTLSAVQSRS
jgi:hypothetical protein